MYNSDMSTSDNLIFVKDINSDIFITFSDEYLYH